VEQVFEPLRATQAAAILVQLAGGELNYTKMLKLLYLADRQSLLETGSTITGDRIVNMRLGPVLSGVYNCVEGAHVDCATWARHFRKQGKYDVALTVSPGDSELSDYDVDVLTALWTKYQKQSYSTMVDIVHRLPEWKNPGAGAVPLSYDEILEAAELPDATIAAFQRLNSAAHSLDQTRPASR
jgi:uncharacterized phage-associated protein